MRYYWYFIIFYLYILHGIYLYMFFGKVKKLMAFQCCKQIKVSITFPPLMLDIGLGVSFSKNPPKNSPKNPPFQRRRRHARGFEVLPSSTTRTTCRNPTLASRPWRRSSRRSGDLRTMGRWDMAKQKVKTKCWAFFCVKLLGFLRFS